MGDRSKNGEMTGTEEMVRYGIGSAAAAAAIFAPLSYLWKGVLVAVSAASIITATYGSCPVARCRHV